MRTYERIRAEQDCPPGCAQDGSAAAFTERKADEIRSASPRTEAKENPDG